MTVNNVIEKFNGSNTERMKRCSERLYLSYFACITGAKAVGFVEGDMGFKALLLLGFILFGGKIILSHNSIREWIFIISSLALGTIIYLRTGDIGFFMYMTMMLGMKDVSPVKVCKLGAIIWCGGITIMTLLSLTGVVSENVRVSPKPLVGMAYRHDFGYSHPNTLGIAVATAVMLVMYSYMCSERKYVIAITACLFVWSLIYFGFTFSVTGLVLVSVYLLFNLYLHYRKEYSTLEKIIFELVFPACIACAIIVPLLLFHTNLLDGIHPFLSRLGTFYDRFKLTNDGFQNYPILPVGTRMNFTTDAANYFVIDSSYTWLVLQLGWIATLFIITLFGALIHNCIKERNGAELAIIFALLIAGISEPFMFNTSFKNLIFIFAGAFVYKMLRDLRLT